MADNTKTATNVTETGEQFLSAVSLRGRGRTDISATTTFIVPKLYIRGSLLVKPQNLLKKQNKKNHTKKPPATAL